MAIEVENFEDAQSIVERLKDSTQVYQKLQKTLLDPSEKMAERFRALFTLKSFGNEKAIEIISMGFNDDSELFKHEVAYVLGQMKKKESIPYLENVLRNQNQQVMVRHEAAEALGAIGELQSIPILTEYLNDPSEAVRQTCELAIEKIQHGDSPKIIYDSIDPAPAFDTPLSVQELQEMLLNQNLNLFKRYRAMFSLRNLGTKEAVLALASGFNDPSALFRHEIAYIFGQMQSPYSVPSLKSVLERPNEEAMVRHECAEALGSIASTDCLPVLKHHVNDKESVVRESCEVALDMFEYEASNEFHYINDI